MSVSQYIKMKLPKMMQLLILLYHVLIYSAIVACDKRETTSYHINDTAFEESGDGEDITISYSYTTDNIFSKPFFTFEEINNFLVMQKSLDFLNTIKNQNVRKNVKTYLYHCPYNDICNFTLGLGNSFAAKDSCCGPCRCDEACRLDGQCCPDMITELEGIIANEAVLKCQYATLFLPPPLNSAITDTGHYFIADCPTGSHQAIRTGCTRIYNYDDEMLDNLDFSNMIPVTHIRSRLNYRNKFCASCHMVKEEDFVPWDVSLRCKYFFTQFSFQMIAQNIRSKDCRIDFQPPHNLGYKQEICHPTISSCNETGKWLHYNEELERLCHSSYGSTFDNKFKNVFCMLCNNATNLRNPSCPPPRIPPEVSFTALLNFEREEENNEEEMTHCPGGMIFDPYMQQCRKMYCSSTRVLRDAKCVNFWNTAEKTTWKILLGFLPLERCPFSSSDQILERISNWFNDLLPEWMPFQYSVCNRAIAFKVNYTYNILLDSHNTNAYGNDTAYSKIADSNVLMFYSRWQFELRGPYGLDRVYEMVQNITKINITLELDDTTEMILLPRTVNMAEAWFDHVSASTDMFFNYVQNDNNSLNFVNSGRDQMSITYKRSFDNNTIITYPTPNDQTTYCVPLSISLTLLDMIPCTLIELDVEQIDWYFTEYGVYLPKLDLHLNMTDFIIVTNATLHLRTLRICTNEYMASQGTKRTNSTKSVFIGAEVILSVVCTSLSLVCLLITFLLYLFFQELQTLPGKNNMLLIINLFFAQIMYLVFVMSSNFTGWLCKTVGISLHFLWLSTIFWLNICTFHMVKTFVRLRKPDTQTKKSSKIMIIYIITVVILSAIFVLINIINSLVISNLTEIGYGLGTCYISNGTMLLYTFALPVGFVVISNLIMFLVVVYQIRSISNIEKNVKHERNNAVILVKFSSLTGITWIFGFLHEFTKEIVLSYIFIILNASLGVFIMASFTLNQKVFRLVRNKLTVKAR